MGASENPWDEEKMCNMRNLLKSTGGISLTKLFIFRLQLSELINQGGLPLVGTAIVNCTLNSEATGELQ